MHQAIVDVAVTGGGDILAAGHCDYPWVRRYGEGGVLLWEHRFAQGDFPVSLYPTERGFVVASVRTADRWGRIGLSSTIRHVSALGVTRSTIRWPGCQTIARVRPASDGGVVALGTCKNALVLAKFAAP
jgi:hypothetical protein